MTPDADTIERLYQATLKPRIDALEGLRRNLRWLVVKAAILVGVPLAGIIFGELLEPLLPGMGYLIPWASFALLLLALVVAFRLYFLPTFTTFANYTARFKKEVVAEVFSVVCPTATYEPFQSLPESIFDEAGLFRAGSYDSDDLVRGRIGETPFEAAEVRRSYSTGTGKSRKSHVVFRGLFFHIDFNKALQGTTIVQPASAGATQIGDRSTLTAVTIGDPAFAEEFTLYATNPAEAREILTPSLRARLLSLRQSAAHPIFAGFKNNRLYLGVHYDRALFEPGIATTVSLAAIQEMAANFALAERVVQELDLNTRIWKPVDATLLDRPAVREDELAEELMTGTLTTDEAWTKVARLAGAGETDTGPAPRPPDSRIDVQHDANGAVISYGTPISFVVTLAISAACAVVALYALRALSASLELGPLSSLLRRLPAVDRIDTLVADLPIAWLAGSAVLGSFISLWWITRVRHVTITRDAVLIARGLRPIARRYPRPPYGRIVRLEKAVYVGKTGGTGLINPSASPILRSEDEARWIASEMRRALR